MGRPVPRCGRPTRRSPPDGGRCGRRRQDPCGRPRIFALWLACHTQEEIARAVGLSQPQVVEEIKVLSDLEKFPNPIKLAALYQDADWSPPHLTRRRRGCRIAPDTALPGDK